jgi:hypothetical protein
LLIHRVTGVYHQDNDARPLQRGDKILNARLGMKPAGQLAVFIAQLGGLFDRSVKQRGLETLFSKVQGQHGTHGSKTQDADICLGSAQFNLLEIRYIAVKF